MVPPDMQSSASRPTSRPNIDEAFVADRVMFWSRFTTFTTGAVIAVVVLLVLMAVFLV